MSDYVKTAVQKEAEYLESSGIDPYDRESFLTSFMSRVDMLPKNTAAYVLGYADSPELINELWSRPDVQQNELYKRSIVLNDFTPEDIIIESLKDNSDEMRNIADLMLLKRRPDNMEPENDELKVQFPNINSEVDLTKEDKPAYIKEFEEYESGKQSIATKIIYDDNQDRYIDTDNQKSVEKRDNKWYYQDNNEEVPDPITSHSIKKADIQRPKTLVIDLDGTIVEDLPEYEHGKFGDLLPGAKDVIFRLTSEGWYVIIDSCRGEVPEIVEHLTLHGIPFHAVNHNPYQPKSANPGKPMADYRIDNSAIHFNGDWESVYNEIKNRENNKLKPVTAIRVIAESFYSPKENIIIDRVNPFYDVTTPQNMPDPVYWGDTTELMKKRKKKKMDRNKGGENIHDRLQNNNSSSRI